jgi:hypothetical protein
MPAARRAGAWREAGWAQVLRQGTLPQSERTVLNRVLERQDTALGLRLVADVRILLVHADHDAGVLRPANDGREDGAGRVVARKAGLAHAGAVVDHEGLDIATFSLRWGSLVCLLQTCITGASARNRNPGSSTPQAAEH